MLFHLTIRYSTQTTQIGVLIGSFSNCLNLGLNSSSAFNAGLHIVSPVHQWHLVRFLCREPAGFPRNTHFLEHQYTSEHIHRTLKKNLCTSARPHRGDRYHFTTPSPAAARSIMCCAVGLTLDDVSVCHGSRAHGSYNVRV